MEVVYTGIRQTPAEIARAARAHNARVIGLSILSGAHLTLFPRVLDALQQEGIDAGSVLLLAGGIMPDEDIPALKEMGFTAIFGPGTTTNDITTFIREALRDDPKE
jgi:methylmalonyl-CoA mutase C-terminal domain/subunit